MCLIIVRPRGVPVPRGLLGSACAFNPHGFGLTHLGRGATRTVRSMTSDFDAVIAQVEACGDHPFVLHFRYRTSGPVDLISTHPLPVGRRFLLFHNGTMRPEDGDDGNQSDTAQLAQDYLGPILERRPELIESRRLHDLIHGWLGPGHRLVLVDQVALRWHILNEASGFELGGLWLSNERWFDPHVVEGLRPRRAPADPVPVFAA
jgi:hypothetical protein